MSKNKEINWEALLNDEEISVSLSEAPPMVSPSRLSGLLTLNLEIDTTLSDSSENKALPFPHKYERDQIEEEEENDTTSDSISNLKSLHDLDELFADEQNTKAPEENFETYEERSQSENTFNISEELNVKSVGELLSERIHHETSEAVPETENNFSNAKSSHKIPKIDSEPYNYSEDTFDEDYEDDFNSDTEEVTESIKAKSVGWKVVKEKVLNRDSIPVFLVNRKKFSRDLSIRSVDSKSYTATAKSPTEVDKSYATDRTITPTSSKSSGHYKMSSKAVNKSDFSDSTSVENVVLKEPECPRCSCKYPIADLNTKPISVLRGVPLDPQTLVNLSEMSPDKITILNLLKAQYNLTRGILDITNSIISSNLESCTPNHKYTTWKDTKRYIKKHKKTKKREVKTNTKS